LPTLIREPQVLAKLGISHSTLWSKVRDRIIPAPVKIEAGGRATFWIESEIDDLIVKATKRRDAALGAAEHTAA
jgi:predicted DNA-binding transcriptional regulator AlpA